MKSNLENSFKESLQDFDMPYNADAWKAMSSKLDAKLPTTAAPKSNFKWYAIASTVVVGSIGAYFFLTQDNHVNDQAEEQIVQNEINTIDDQNGNPSNSDTQINLNNENPSQSDSPVLNDAGNSLNNHSNGGEISNDRNNTLIPVPMDTEHGFVIDPDPTVVDPIKETNVVKPFIMPTIGEMCKGSSVSIENENKLKLFILSPSGDSFHVKPMANGSFTANESGTHQVGYYDKEGFVGRTKFNVLDAPFVDMTINTDRKYKDGVPVTQVETSVPGSKFEWNFGTATSNGRTAEAHFFKKGEHSITLTVTGANGCESKATESIYIDHVHGNQGNYNLLAAKGINLNSNDVRNRSFMPDGLKDRDVNFKMVIYSMADGHVVFESSDVTNPWRGVDISTGQQVEHGTTYYWEIILENPMEGENNKYKGGITVLLD